MKKNDRFKFNLNDISVYKNEIYGAAIIWIMLFHAIDMLGLSYSKSFPALSIVDDLIGFGNMGVEVFLLCSGICLYFSFQKNKDIGVFLKKRIIRLFVPVILIETVYWIYICFLSPEAYGWVAFFERELLIRFWLTGDRQIYFVSLIFACYLLYPYIYSVLFPAYREKTKTGVRCAVLIAAAVFTTVLIMNGQSELYSKIEIALTRFPIFIFGCYMGKAVYERKPVPRRVFWIVAFVTIVQFLILNMDLMDGIWERYFYFIGGVSVTLLIPMILKILSFSPLNRMLSFMGNISLNLYLVHVMIIRLYRYTSWSEEGRLLHYLVIMIISIILSYVVEIAVKKIRKIVL